MALDRSTLTNVIALVVALACCVVFLALSIPASRAANQRSVAPDLPALAQSLKKATVLDPSDSAAFLQLATVELALGHNGAAQQALAVYKRLKGDD